MSKTVLVKTPNGRNFKVSFSTREKQSDFEAFKEVFFKICDKDSDLSRILNRNENQFLSFQTYDSTFECNIEITDFEDIPNGTIIELFITNSAILNISIVESESKSTILENRSDPMPESPRNLMIESPGNLMTESPSDFDMNPTMDMSNTHQSTTAVRSPKKVVRKCQLSYPCALPEFSLIVKENIENGTIGMHQNYARFVRECATFLLSMVQKPTRSDYDVFCRTLANKYDFINVVTGIPGAAPYAYFKKTLSRSIRNSRCYRYKKEAKKSTMSSVEIMIDNQKMDNFVTWVQEAAETWLDFCSERSPEDCINLNKALELVKSEIKKNVLNGVCSTKKYGEAANKATELGG